MTSKKEKIIAFFFIMLMSGSAVTFALQYIFGEKEQPLQIPQEKILNYELSDQQKGLLLSKYYTLVEYHYYTGCLECSSLRNDLEFFTQNSDNQIYLQEIISNTNLVSVTVRSLRGQKTIDNPIKLEVQNSICNLIVGKPPLWCVTSQI